MYLDQSSGRLYVGEETSGGRVLAFDNINLELLKISSIN